MTWTKLGTEFFDELVDREFKPDLDDACQLTHAQAVHFVYSIEAMDGTFPKRAVRRFATSDRATEAARELVRTGVWEDTGERYRIRHHLEVVRQSLFAQTSKREKDRERQQKHRNTKAAKATGVTTDVTRDVAATQTDRQTTKQPDSDKKHHEIRTQEVDDWDERFGPSSVPWDPQPVRRSA
ncbi:hypothetical protein ACWIE7_10975 [Dietzia sp. NPDC055343]